MAAKFSAYLSIYNDWDILPASLRSVASYIDELVVIDGAYDWMLPYLTMLGIDPLQSDARVYAAIEASGIPFRVISETWKSEPQKRQAGYEACTHDYIYRIDADEVIYFDDVALETALSRGLAVGDMSMPNYIAPGWISRANDLPQIERQCFLFDRRQVSSQLHLNYLWLVLTVDKLPLAAGKPFDVYPEPLAFNAHLTAWRTPATCVNRAAFYVLNWMRQNGVPWLAELRDQPLADLQALFDIVPPGYFLSSLSRGRIAFGMVESPTKRSFAPSPLRAGQEAPLKDLYKNFLDSLATKNLQALAEEQPFLSSVPILLDISTEAARQAVASSGTVSLKLSSPLHAAKAKMLTYAKREPNNSEQDLPVQVSGTDMHIELPDSRQERSVMLRQCVEFQVWPQARDIQLRFRVLA